MGSTDYLNQNPEQQARDQIDRRLDAAGWAVQDWKEINLGEAYGVAVREHPTDTGSADYILYVDRQAVGVIEAKYVMHEGDIVLGRRGEMGRCAVVGKAEDGWLCGTGSLFLSLSSEFVSEFYSLVISSQRIKDYLSKESIGTTMQNLNQKVLHSVPVPVCSFEEQKIIVGQLTSQFETVLVQNELYGAEIKQSDAQRKNILKSAFSGELVPQDPNDEPASELLARIKTERGKLSFRSRRKRKEVNE